TPGRLRVAKYVFSSSSSVITKTESNIPIAFNLLAAILVFGASKLNDSTTEIRSSRANCDKIERIPARYIFLFTFWRKFSSGLLGNVRPPPRHKVNKKMYRAGIRSILSQ